MRNDKTGFFVFIISWRGVWMLTLMQIIHDGWGEVLCAIARLKNGLVTVNRGSGRFVGQSVYIMLYNVNISPFPLLPGLVWSVSGSGFCACYIPAHIRLAVTLPFPSFSRPFLLYNAPVVADGLRLSVFPHDLRIYGSKAHEMPYFFILSLVFSVFLSFALFSYVFDSLM